jgi:hypothetical protein
MPITTSDRAANGDITRAQYLSTRENAALVVQRFSTMGTNGQQTSRSDCCDEGARPDNS